ncbi:TPA: hypothetical protein DCX16_01300 [bacterium]|nr:hypothetical protein [bacterium]
MFKNTDGYRHISHPDEKIEIKFKRTYAFHIVLSIMKKLLDRKVYPNPIPPRKTYLFKNSRQFP